jgi:hypothetical protein
VLLSIGLLGNISLEPVVIYDALVAATKGPARDAGVRHGSSWHADDIDEQRASSPVSWQSAFQEARVVGEIIAGELRVAKFNDKVRDVVATKDRECGIRIIFKKAVLSLTPERNELAGLHMPGHARRTISETHGYGIHSAQDELSFAEAHILRVLHEEDVDFSRLLAGGGPGYQRSFIGRFRWRLRIGRGQIGHATRGKGSTNQDEPLCFHKRNFAASAVICL